MNAFWFVLVGVLLIVIALLGRFLDRLPVSPAMIYLLVGMALGPAALDMLELHPLRELTMLEMLSEVALLIALFTVGIKLRVPIGDVRWTLPLRLATLSMLATVLGITLVAWLFFGFSPGLALVLGAALAPTDPVLASEVQLRSPQDRDALRFGLTGEGGLNDGTAFPFVLLGLGLLGAGDVAFSLGRWFAVEVLWSAPVGLGVGFAVGTLLAAGVRALRTRFSNAVIFDEFLLLGVIALSYGIALSLHALGFLAVFAAGIALRRADDLHAHRREITQTASAQSPLTPSMLSVNEQLERIAEVAIVLLVGVMISTGYWSAAGLGIAAVLFAVIRPLSVYAGVAGAQAAVMQRRLLGWFGIRGIGSFYYAIYAVNLGSDQILHAQAEQLLSCVFTVIAASIVVHGVSAAPLMELYHRRWSRGRARAGSVGQTMTGTGPASHDITGSGRSRALQQSTDNSCMEPMDWSRIAGNWTHWRGRIRERWGKLTDDHLDVIAGKRDQLAGRIQELYGLQKDEAERQLRNWERNLFGGED